MFENLNVFTTNLVLKGYINVNDNILKVLQLYLFKKLDSIDEANLGAKVHNCKLKPCVF